MRTIKLLSTALLVFHSVAAVAADAYQPMQPMQYSEAQIQQAIPMPVQQPALGAQQREPILVAPAPAVSPSADSSSASHLMRFNFGI